MARVVIAPYSHDSRESLEQSYAQYRTELRRYFARKSRYQSPTAAEDLVQQVYERMLRYPPETPVRDPVSYLFRIARNVLWDANREARTEQQRCRTAGAQELELFAQGISALWVQEDGGHALAAREIEHVLNQLPYACRVALIRQRFEGRTHQQIAEELGVSVYTVRDYLAKAMSHFHLHYSLSPGDAKGY